jgi:arylsulfatase A-like enzyme
MDRNIGRVIEYLEKTGEIDSAFGCRGACQDKLTDRDNVDTVIIFMSDNGAEGAALEGERHLAS